MASSWEPFTGRIVSGASTLPKSNSLGGGPRGSSPYKSETCLSSSNLSLTAVFSALSCEIIPFTRHIIILLGSPTSFCTWRTMIPCFNKETQLMVNSWAKNVMQKEQINDVCRLKTVYHFVPCDRKECKKKNDQRQQRYLFRVAQYVDYVQRAQRLCFPYSTPCVSA